MISIFKKSLLVLGFASVSFSLVSARTVIECKTQLKEMAQALLEERVYNPRLATFVKENVILTEEELIEFCDQLLLYRKDLGSKANDVENIKSELISYLRSFVASGMDVGEVDPNLAFFFDEQNPDFTVVFKNSLGEVKTRKYALKIWSIGAKFEFAIRVEGIAIIGSDFNYYDSIGKEYDLGSGIDFGLYPHNDIFSVKILEFIDNEGRHIRMVQNVIGICFITSKIKETGSTLVITGIAFGLGGSFTGTGLELSYVYGGKMTPVKE